MEEETGAGKRREMIQHLELKSSDLKKNAEAVLWPKNLIPKNQQFPLVDQPRRTGRLKFASLVLYWSYEANVLIALANTWPKLIAARLALCRLY